MAFWQEKTLAEMSDDEWESLCDGCAKCCMIKLEDEETAEIHYTAMVCDLLDLDACRCTAYPDRHSLVPDCVVLDAETALAFTWLPKSCAYRTLAEGRDLPEWHPLVSGDTDSVHKAQRSVRDRVIPVGQVHEEEHEEMVIQWVEI